MCIINLINQSVDSGGERGSVYKSDDLLTVAEVYLNAVKLLS